MRPVRALLGLVAVVLLPACAQTTTLILLPDDDGRVGSVTLRTGDDFTVLNQRYERVEAPRAPLFGASVETLTPAEVDRAYSTLLKAQPLPSLSFSVHFSRGSADLADRARAIVPQIIAGVRARVPAAITIVGHTDTTGTESLNAKLALERAQTVEKVLREGIPANEQVRIHSYGSRGLIVPTPPNVDEPRNRVVEILIL